MKKILTLNIKQLRTEESFGYLKQVETETGFSSPRDGGIGGSSVCLRFHSGANAEDLPMNGGLGVC